MSAADIEFDVRTRRLSGAGPLEWLALRSLSVALFFLGPVHHFGFSYVCRLVRAVLPSRRKMVFVLGPDSRMRTDYCDAYWSILLKPGGFSYETENARLMNGCRDIRYGFIDGGANHGYWSVLISGAEGGRKPVVAVEAATDTYDHLADNLALNGNRFVALNRAIGATSGERVLVYGAKHEARSIVQPDADAKPILDAVSISLDDIADHEAFKGVEAFVVKLDVEGVEIPAMEAAKRLMAGNTVFIYEDHGSDMNHETTRHALAEMGLRVFWLGRDASAGEITDARQLDAIKKSRRVGYDFAASKSPFWIERLSALVADPAGADARTAA